MAAALVTLPASAGGASAREAGVLPPTGNVRGQVLSHAEGHPIAGAVVTLPDFGMRTTSLRDGTFVFPEALPTRYPYRRIDAVVTARGFGRWTIRGAPLYPNDTLELRAEMRATPFDHAVLTPEERAAHPQPQAPASNYSYTCTGWGYTGAPPQNIWVWITADNVSQQYDFVFYATHVLPDEWISSWDADSLGAGAVAVKTYGYYRAMDHHAYSGGPGCADLVDSSQDQVFDPTWSTSATDQAVYATLGSILWKDSTLFLSHYFTGAQGDPCAPVTGQYAGWMDQWATQTCALASMLWPDIVTTFYNVGTSWFDLYQLLLDPSAESGVGAQYAWTTGTGTIFTRMYGGGYDNGGHYFQIQPPPTGGNGVAREIRPWNGTSATTYHDEEALECPTSNPTSCTIVVNVAVIEQNGTLHIKSKTVVVPNDGAWRFYTFDPKASGYTHTQVKLSIQSLQTFGLDACVLTTPYGGP